MLYLRIYYRGTLEYALIASDQQMIHQHFCTMSVIDKIEALNVTHFYRTAYMSIFKQGLTLNDFSTDVK